MKKRIPLSLLIICGVFALIAIAAAQLYSRSRPVGGYIMEKARRAASHDSSDEPRMSYGQAEMSMSPEQKVTPSSPLARKLIKRAELNLEVKSCEYIAAKINGLVSAVSGIIIDSQVQKYPNEAKRGYTVLKVPPQDFDTVLVQLKALGKLDLERITGEDVTEEYVDLEARLKNSEAVRDRLMNILEEKARQVKDILEVERELGRVGEIIEQLKGRMKFLDRQVDLATITVNYYEPKAVAPESLNILKRIKETIRAAIETFINVFNGTIVFIAAIIPIAIWAALIFIIVMACRRGFFRKKGK